MRVTADAPAGHGNASDHAEMLDDRSRAWAMHSRTAMKWVAMLMVVAACSDEPGDPFTGEVHRFAVDSMILPSSSDSSRDLGADLDGDGAKDNQLGTIVAFLVEYDLTRDDLPAELIAAGTVAMSIDMQADDLETDDAAVVWLRSGDGEARPVPGSIAYGAFKSRRLGEIDRTGSDTLVLPTLADADPTPIDLAGFQLSLTPDGRGYRVAFQGVADAATTRAAAGAAIAQSLREQPARHRVMWGAIDVNRDGEISDSEIAENQLLTSFFAPDITLGGEDYLSLGIQLHVAPCEAGTCLAAAAPTCGDRIRSGAETDVDCGGPDCGPCAGTFACQVADDCQVARCDAGTCASPTCTDGEQNGFESDVDCSGVCGPCTAGKRCELTVDCQSGICDSTGRCQ